MTSDPHDRKPGDGGVMIILRGLSGAGKTTYQRHNQPKATVCTTEDYFDRTLPRLPVEAFRPASANCFLDAIAACERGDAVIVIDNTGSSMAEVAPYVQLAEGYRYAWKVVTITADFGAASRRNVHGTPNVANARILTRMSDFDRAVPNWWRFQGQLTTVRLVYEAETLAELHTRFDGVAPTPTDEGAP